MANAAIRKFPLYDELRVEAQNASTKEWGKLCLIINSLQTPENLEVIFALIYHHSLLHSDTTISPQGVPYNGRLLSKKKAPKFEINDLPLELAEIIAAYLKRLTR